MRLADLIEKIATTARDATPALKLKEVKLADPEDAELRRLLQSARASGIASLASDDRAAWGALELYDFARTPEVDEAAEPYRESEIDAIDKGKRLWMKFGFERVEHEMKRLTNANARRGEHSEDAANAPDAVRASDEAKGRRTGLRLETSPLPSRDGHHRLGVRAVGARQSEPVRCSLESDDSVATVTLHSIDGDEVDSNHLELFVNAVPRELRFTIASKTLTKVRLRLQVAPDEKVARSLRLPGVFVPNDE